MSTNSQPTSTKNGHRPRVSDEPARLSGKEAVVLELLHDGEQYGLEIVRL
jgi:hypothetical protein